MLAPHQIGTVASASRQTRTGVNPLFSTLLFSRRCIRRFTLTRCRSPSITHRRPDDQINDYLRPALLALLLKKGQRRLDRSNPIGGYRDQQMPAFAFI